MCQITGFLWPVFPRITTESYFLFWHTYTVFMENSYLQKWITNFRKSDNVKNSPTVYNELKYYCVKVSQYVVIYGLNTEKYRPEITPYLDTFHVVYYCQTQKAKKTQVQTMKYCKFTKTLKNSTDFNTGRLNNKLPRRKIFIVPCVWHQYVQIWIGLWCGVAASEMILHRCLNEIVLGQCENVSKQKFLDIL